MKNFIRFQIVFKKCSTLLVLVLGMLRLVQIFENIGQLGFFLVSPSQIYLVINDTWPPHALKSTGKCENRAHSSYVRMDIHSHIYLINDNGPPFAFNSTGTCEREPIYNLLVGICSNGYPFSHMSTDK